MEDVKLSVYTLSNLYVCRELIKMDPTNYPMTLVEELEKIMEPNLSGPASAKKSYAYGYRVMGTFKKLISGSHLSLEDLRSFVREQLSSFVESYGLSGLPKGLAKVVR